MGWGQGSRWHPALAGGFGRSVHRESRPRGAAASRPGCMCGAARPLALTLTLNWWGAGWLTSDSSFWKKRSSAESRTSAARCTVSDVVRGEKLGSSDYTPGRGGAGDEAGKRGALYSAMQHRRGRGAASTTRRAAPRGSSCCWVCSSAVRTDSSCLALSLIRSFSPCTRSTRAVSGSLDRLGCPCREAAAEGMRLPCSRGSCPSIPDESGTRGTCQTAGNKSRCTRSEGMRARHEAPPARWDKPSPSCRAAVYAARCGRRTRVF